MTCLNPVNGASRSARAASCSAMAPGWSQYGTSMVGAGPNCDAQVLVWQDMVGLRQGKMQRFVKQYANLAQVIGDAAASYVNEVRRGEFPTAEHTFSTNLGQPTP